jgi:hypothetical protein
MKSQVYANQSSVNIRAICEQKYNLTDDAEKAQIKNEMPKSK